VRTNACCSSSICARAARTTHRTAHARSVDGRAFAEAARDFERVAEELTANGFEVAQMGPRSVAIHAAPSGIATSDAERLLMEILDGTERENSAISMDSLQRNCGFDFLHAAIK